MLLHTHEKTVTEHGSNFLEKEKKCPIRENMRKKIWEIKWKKLYLTERFLDIVSLYTTFLQRKRAHITIS